MKLAAGALAVFLALPAFAQDDKAFQDAFKKFQDDFYRANAGEDEKIDAVRAFAQLKSERVVKALAPSLTRGPLKVRMAVAREFGGFTTVAGVPEVLVGALKSYETGGKRTNGIRILALRSLGQLKAKDAAVEVDKLIVDKDTWISKAAIDAAGQIRVKSSIDPLVRALRRVEGPDGKGEITVNPLQDELPPLTGKSIIQGKLLEQARPPSERDVLSEPILQSLKSITKANFASAKEWESWWSKSKSSFRVPE